ncbi:basic salivary proline-rich protein 3-like [Mustela lutreola]|uniref:basic salivary proline-rich protein 3-like n=1 Tax=Mustela lutreola TaxID=9666 RepID=UPI0027973A16|nr:basic salivary proline-rich protein 3-like [Mustela lutreola]
MFAAVATGSGRAFTAAVRPLKPNTRFCNRLRGRRTAEALRSAARNACFGYALPLKAQRASRRVPGSRGPELIRGSLLGERVLGVPSPARPAGPGPTGRARGRGAAPRPCQGDSGPRRRKDQQSGRKAQAPRGGGSTTSSEKPDGGRPQRPEEAERTSPAPPPGEAEPPPRRGTRLERGQVQATGEGNQPPSSPPPPRSNRHSVAQRPPPCRGRPALARPRRPLGKAGEGRAGERTRDPGTGGWLRRREEPQEAEGAEKDTTDVARGQSRARSRTPRANERSSLLRGAGAGAEGSLSAAAALFSQSENIPEVSPVKGRRPRAPSPVLPAPSTPAGRWLAGKAPRRPRLTAPSFRARSPGPGR